MGTEITGNTVGLAKPPIGNTDREKRTRTGNDRNSSPEAARTGTAANPGGTAGNREEAGAKKATISGVAHVAPPSPVEPQKKQRRKTTTKKKKGETALQAEQIQALILTASSIVASRPGFEIWVLSPDEANQLSTPIANMIEKSEKLKEISEHADAISLITASLMIFTPRAFVAISQKKAKKSKQVGGVEIVRGKKEIEKRESTRSVVKNDGISPTDAKDNISSISDAIPSTIF